jgi:GUN4-like/Caspase domain
MAKIALLIGVSEYEEGLKPLPAAANNIKALREILVNRDIGDFDEAHVKVLHSPQRQEMEEAIFDLFDQRQKDDLVLLYFVGHGILDEDNQFYFATRQTRKNQGRLRLPTALVASTVQHYMKKSRSQRQVVILDSCFSGAFGRGQAMDCSSVNLEQFLGGKGRAILTACTSTQYAMAPDGSKLSIYTHFLVEGLCTGDADLGRVGWITVDDLHNYAKAKVMEAAPSMTPEFSPLKEGYTIRLARSPNREGDSILNLDLLAPLRRLLVLNPEVLSPLEYEPRLVEYETTVNTAFQVEQTERETAIQDLRDGQRFVGLRDQDVVRIFRYKRLEEYLKRQQWCEADAETYQLILVIGEQHSNKVPTNQLLKIYRQLVGMLCKRLFKRESLAGNDTFNGFTSRDLQSFPRDALVSIDELWVRYSHGRFGFSVQRGIYLSLGGRPGGRPSHEIWMRFSEEVGWQRDRIWRDYRNLNSSLPFPNGSFPDFDQCRWRDSWVWCFISRTDL